MIDPRDHFLALIESSDDAIISKDLDGIVLSWNPSAERIFGYRAEEMIGQSIRRLLPEDRHGEEDAILERIRAAEVVGMFYTKRRHKDGHLIDIALTVSPVRNREGSIVGASKIARDVSEWMESQKRLRESEQRFEVLANNIPQLAWMAEPDGRIFWYNQRWYDFTGTTFEQMEGWGWTKVHHPDHLEHAETSWRAALDAGVDWEDTFPLRGSDGEYRWFLSRAEAVHNSAGDIVLWFGTNTDVTSHREQSEQIRLLLMEVNHRSKNLLSTVLALARRTARDGGEDFIARFTDRIASLSINQDILVRREWSEVPLEELVRLQLGFIERGPSEFEIEGPDLCITPRSAEVIGMALHELATNALKYGAFSAGGGKVRVAWTLNGERAEEGFTIVWEESGGPPVEQPQRSGFGTALIRDVPQGSVGDVTLDYRPGGLRWELRCARGAVANSGRGARLPG